MDFSVWPNMSYPVEEILDLARWLDAGEWHGFWFADHYMGNTGTTEVSDTPGHECWAILPAVAAVTCRMRLGPLVAPTSIHHPALLANRAVTIDHLSNGRFVLGLGAGWQINEHHAYGIELEAPGRRVTRFEESIQIIRSLLDQPRTDFDGKIHTIRDAPCEPTPVQERLPILVGTGGDRMLRITARHADEWNTWGRPDGAAERMAAMRAACERVGRDPGTLRCSVQSIVVVTDDDEATKRVLNGPGGERAIAGRPTELVEMLAAYREIGFDEFIVPDWFMGPTATARREMLERFMTEVVSALD
ncbi:MAG: LLM class flavin-dependent oxidoreductase [Ilumatobacteraceae bacterium]